MVGMRYITVGLILGWVCALTGTLQAKEPIAKEQASQFDRKNRTFPFVMRGEGHQDRSMADWRELRAYVGAPPRIPHPVAPSGPGGQDNCLSCHKEGGYVPKWEKMAPVTPHPAYVSCQQCHVTQQTESVFRESAWMPFHPDHHRYRAMPGGPPIVPHLLQLRGDCIACHSGPAAIREIRTSHPERVHCLQCHVSQQGEEGWQRASTQQP